jgi:hypothetical protein
MLPETTGIDPRLAEAVDALETANPGWRVLAASVYRLPYARLTARAVMQAPRRFNVLEEFVLRAATELEPAPTPAELAALLGLDQLFIDAALADLAALKIVSPGPTVALTAAGRKQFKQGQAMQPAEHHALTLVYRPALDDLQLWRSLRPVDAPLLPGLPEAEREALPSRAVAAVTVERVQAALAGDGQPLVQAGERRALTGVDQVGLDNLGSYGCGVLVVQDTRAEPGRDNLALHAIDLESQAHDPALQRRLDAWLNVGQAHMRDYLPGVEAGEAETAPEAADTLDLGELARQPDSGVELLRANNQDDRARHLLRTARQAVLLVLPALDAGSLNDALLAHLHSLAGRGVPCLIGWGQADERDQEPGEPEPAGLRSIEAAITPDGLPAAAVWWVGQQVGQDVVFDRGAMLSTVPGTVVWGGEAYSAGSATYLIDEPELVQSAVDDLEPSFARAARQAWNSLSRAPQAARPALQRCCLTWVAIRRPGEALSHILKLAAAGAEAMPRAWEAMAVTCLALSRLPDADLAAMEAPAGLRRAAAEFLDWADSAGPAGAGCSPPAASFLNDFHAALTRFAISDQADGDDTRRLFDELRQTWAAAVAEAGPSALDVFAPAPAEAKPDRPKKRRY